MAKVPARLALALVANPGLIGIEGFALSSPAFDDHEELDPTFTAEEEDACAPPLAWTAPPEGTEALVLVVEDASSDGPEPVVQMIGWGMNPGAGILLEGENPPAVGANSDGKQGWLAPDLVLGEDAHSFVFQLFALDVPMELAPGSDRESVIEEMEDHVIGVAILTGVYAREEREVDDLED